MTMDTQQNAADMTRHTSKAAELIKERDRLFDALKDEVQLIQSLSWLAVHANESSRVGYSNDDYLDHMVVAMQTVARSAKRADDIIWGDGDLRSSLTWLSLKVDREAQL